MFIAVHQLDVLPNVAKRSRVISGLWNMKDIYLVWSCSQTICISKYFSVFCMVIMGSALVSWEYLVELDFTTFSSKLDGSRHA